MRMYYYVWEYIFNNMQSQLERLGSMYGAVNKDSRNARALPIN